LYQEQSFLQQSLFAPQQVIQVIWCVSSADTLTESIKVPAVSATETSNISKMRLFIWRMDVEISFMRILPLDTVLVLTHAGMSCLFMSEVEFYLSRAILSVNLFRRSVSSVKVTEKRSYGHGPRGSPAAIAYVAGKRDDVRFRPWLMTR
jgi:hypothetical protein